MPGTPAADSLECTRQRHGACDEAYRAGHQEVTGHGGENLEGSAETTNHEHLKQAGSQAAGKPSQTSCIWKILF